MIRWLIDQLIERNTIVNHHDKQMNDEVIFYAEMAENAMLHCCLINLENILQPLTILWFAVVNINYDAAAGDVTYNLFSFDCIRWFHSEAALWSTKVRTGM